MSRLLQSSTPLGGLYSCEGPYLFCRQHGVFLDDGHCWPYDSRIVESVADRTEEQKQAMALCEKTGVPLWGAYRVVRGEITLDQLLKSMLRRQQFEKLKDKDGLDADLAGHVASGMLPKWRGELLQEMRAMGRSNFSQDRINIARDERLELAIWRFGDSEWQTGSIRKSRAYEFSFQPFRQKTIKILKHDVKMVCHPMDVEVIKGASGYDKQVGRQRLVASRTRKDRYRPEDEQLSQLKQTGSPIQWTFRDGTQIYGCVFAFGRWDMDLTVSGGASATIFFHALHSATDASIIEALGAK